MNNEKEKVYESFMKKPLHKGCSRHHRRPPKYSAFRREEKRPPMHCTYFENLNKDHVIEMAIKYKKQFVTDVYNEITKSIYENAEQGITQFMTEEFPIAPTHEEPNILSKLSDEDIRCIERDFREKGFDIKSRMDPGRKSVKFVIKFF